jgi:hypothetical protein
MALDKPCYIGIVKRKRPQPLSATPLAEPIVPEVLLEQARLAIESDRFKKPRRCIVCASECAPNSSEGLCWVCRRLKLSAWRDSDTQVPAQE